MKGTLLVLALLVTRELGIEMGENEKEGKDGLPDIWPNLSPPPPDLWAASGKKFGGELGDFYTGACRKPLRFSVFLRRERFGDEGVISYAHRG